MEQEAQRILQQARGGERITVSGGSSGAASMNAAPTKISVEQETQRILKARGRSAATPSKPSDSVKTSMFGGSRVELGPGVKMVVKNSDGTFDVTEGPREEISANDLLFGAKIDSTRQTYEELMSSFRNINCSSDDRR